METLFKISFKSIINKQTKLILPPNLIQLKLIYKKIFNLNDIQLSKLKIYYMKQEKKIFLEKEADYMNFYLEEHPDLIEAELDNETIENIESNNIIPTLNFLNKSKNNDYLRCLEKDCFLIPYITLNKDKDNNFTINYHCRNSHKGTNIPIEYYKSLLNKKLDNLLCSFCSINKEKEKNIRLYYCHKCKKYICNLEKCNNHHEILCDNKDLIQLEKIDSNCILHGKNLIYYCEDCKISICNLCKNHKNHKKKNIEEMNIDDKKKNLLIEIIDKNLKELEIIKNHIKEKLNKLSTIYEMNKNILELNKKIIENISIKEMNGEIYINFNNCKYIKEINLKNDLMHYNNIFKPIEDYLSNEFFEFDEEKQKFKLLSWGKIPLIISVSKDAKKLFKNKKIDILKYLIPHDWTVSQLQSLLFTKMKNHNYGIYIFVNSIAIGDNRTIKEIYDKHKKDDNILYLQLESGLRYG